METLDTNTKTCQYCEYCSYGMRSGRRVYYCMKIRGNKRDYMEVKANRKACDFFKQD